MEDDDLFCTRCGKEVPGERAGKTPETSDGRKDYGRDDYDPDDYDDEEVDEEYEEYEEEERGSRFDRGTIIMLSAAAVLLLILGVLLFNIMHIPNPGQDSTRDDEIAVYNNVSSQQQNLNEGQQTPASGPSEETSEETPAADEDTYSDTQDSSQQTDPSAVEVPDTDTDTDAEEQQRKEEEEKKKEEQQRAEEERSQEPQQETSEEDDDYYEEDNTGQDDNAGEEDDEYGWTVDEDGNEVYYPEDGEEYEGDDQTGGVSQQSVPETDRGAVSASGGTRAQAGRAASGSEVTALAGSGASNSSEYILPDSNSRLYTREELSGLDDNTLQLAINEIYARHGRKFNTESMQAYFDGKSWYSGTVDPEVFDGNEAAYFNEYEIKNRELLSSIRAERQEAAGTAGQQL
jgi:outer membrane biosynthesis protein TonB